MIKVNRIKLYEKDATRGAVNLQRSYVKPEGLLLLETMNVHREGDYINQQLCRYSSDNGRTFGEWKELPRKNFSEMFGEDERMTWETKRVYNPVHRHYVGTLLSRYCFGGHKAAYKVLWSSTEQSCFDHQYLFISDDIDSEYTSIKHVKFEEGADFDRNNPRNPEHLLKNEGGLNSPAVLKSGDIIVPVSVPMDKLCVLAGLDPKEIFPTVPQFAPGVLVARGKYDPSKNAYDFTFSNPIIISDLESSRGFAEPIITELPSGRILLVLRGSNMQFAPWKTRIEKGTEAYKWYSYSDDGGKTFTAPRPWIFDDGEPVYSSATISEFIRSQKTGKLYWIGNVSNKGEAYDNYPRYPLYICEVDDERTVLKRDTLTVIDTRREGESEKIQLSNFTLFEDRETGDIEVGLIKIAQFDGEPAYLAETWKYIITVD